MAVGRAAVGVAIGIALTSAVKLGDHALPLKLDDGHMPLFVRWEKYLGAESMEGLTFVQVGANCGTNMVECAVGGDPVWEYATRFNWKGVTVEPVPKTFNVLTQNYAPYPNVKPLMAMVSDHDGVGKIQIHGEMSKELVAGDLAMAATGRRTRDVPVYTLTKLWQELGPVEDVKVLVVDAEGNEAKILGGAFPSPKPKLVLFEISNLEKAAFEGIDRNLKANGYKLLELLKHQDPVGLTMEPQDALYGLA